VIRSDTGGGSDKSSRTRSRSPKRSRSRSCSPKRDGKEKAIVPFSAEDVLVTETQLPNAKVSRVYASGRRELENYKGDRRSFLSTLLCDNCARVLDEDNLISGAAHGKEKDGSFFNIGLGRALCVKCARIEKKESPKLYCNSCPLQRLEIVEDDDETADTADEGDGDDDDEEDKFACPFCGPDGDQADNGDSDLETDDA